MFKETNTFSGFSVNDISAAKQFYGETLGLTLEEMPEGVMLHLYGGGKVFLYGKDDHTPATFTVLNFEVENIDQVADELIASGITFERYDWMDEAQPDDKGIYKGKTIGKGPNIAWFKDPAGNVLSILQK